MLPVPYGLRQFMNIDAEPNGYKYNYPIYTLKLMVEKFISCYFELTNQDFITVFKPTN